MSDPLQSKPLAAGVTDLPVDSRWERTIGEVSVLFGQGALEKLGDFARGLGASHALLVTDRGLTRAGHPGRARDILEDASIRKSVFDDVQENPSSQQVEAAAGELSSESIDCIIALGGGSCLDFAKGLNFLLTNGGNMEDYWGWGKAQRPMLPSIGIPTTAGTGSDGQSYAVIKRSSDQRKMACGDPKVRFRQVILDPDLTSTVPQPVKAATGFDAISHAVESYAANNGTAESQALARSAWRLLEANFDLAFGPHADSKVLSSMLIGAHMAGAAIEQSMLGAAHACANPLTARFGLTHGLAVAIMLPHVVRHNSAAGANPYSGLFGAPNASESTRDAKSIDLADRLDTLREDAGLPTSLSEKNIPKDALPDLAQAATDEWTGNFNPRPMSAEDFLAVYEQAY